MFLLFNSFSSHRKSSQKSSAYSRVSSIKNNLAAFNQQDEDHDLKLALEISKQGHANADLIGENEEYKHLGFNSSIESQS